MPEELEQETGQRAPSIRMRTVTKAHSKFLDKLVSSSRKIAPRNKEGGSVEVSRTNKEIMSKVKYVLTTGIRSFDRVTGGFPFGRVTELYGLESCGKTAMCKRAAIRAQMGEIYERVEDPDNPKKKVMRKLDEGTDVTIIYIDNEQSLDDGDGQVIIEDMGQEIELDCVLKRCDTVDQLFKQIDHDIDLIAEHEKETGRQQFVIVIVDTIAGTSSKEEMKQDWDKEDYQRQPKQLRRAFRIMQRKINRQNVCMICTNQVSESYSADKSKSFTPQDKDFSTFGGRALKYYSSLRVFMFKVPTKWILIKGARFAAGFLVGFFTSKNRQIKPLREGRAALSFDFGFHDEFSLLETFLFLDFATFNDDGSIGFRFEHWNIPTKTFGKAPSIDEDAEVAPSRKKRLPTCDCKGAWLEFYKEHQADFDTMWEKAVEYLFATEGLAGYLAAPEDSKDDDGPEDEPEERPRRGGSRPR
jgi:RecA/RadA recombinase